MDADLKKRLDERLVEGEISLNEYRELIGTISNEPIIPNSPIRTHSEKTKGVIVKPREKLAWFISVPLFLLSLAMATIALLILSAFLPFEARRFFERHESMPIAICIFISVQVYNLLRILFRI